MAFVVDASVTSCWAFNDEDHPLARLAFQRIRTDEAVVPSSWWFEVWNILIINERRRRITKPATVAFLSALARLPLREDRARDEGAVLRLAREHHLSVYSAVYLELARREGIPLATLDVRLQEAAIEANVVVLGTSAPDAIG